MGGPGNDTYIIDTTTDTLTEAINAGADTIETNLTLTLLNYTNIENITLTGTSNLNATGNTLNNLLTGNSGSNKLEGGDGNDTLDGGAGIDTLTGGAGNDTYIIDTTTDSFSEVLNAGTDTLQTNFTYNLNAAPNIENLTLIGTANLNGTGTTANNLLTGNSGANTLTAGDGNDTLDGSTGNDTLIGGKGNDIYVTDNGADVITENANEGTDTVQSAVTYTLAATLENLTLIGTANLNGTGNTTNNLLTGNNGNNQLDGSTGNDTLIGGKGNDIYVIDNGADVITENANEGTDTVQSAVTYTLAATLENLTLIGTANLNGTGNTTNNTITGNNGANTITGNDGNDILIGNGGNDTLIGGMANDTLTGGAGQDFFVFNAPTEGIDNINDFSLIDDTIRVSASGFGSGLVAGALNANQFILGAAATTGEQRFIYNSSTGTLLFDADGNNASAALPFATLNTGLALTYSDIFIS